MALSFRTATQNSSSTGTAISVATPTGTTTGDLVKVVVHGNGQTTIVDNNVTITSTNLTTGSDTDGGTSCSTASVTPSAYKLILLTVTSRTSITADPNQPTVTGNGLTWVAIGTSVFDSTSASRRRVTLFRSMGSAPSTGAITIDFGGQTQSSMTWVLDELGNVDTSGTNGSGAIVQSATNQNPVDTGVTSLTVTLAAFSSANNATYGAFGNGGEGSMTAGSGFAITNQTQHASNSGAAAEFKATNDTSVDITTPNAFIGGIAIEVKANSGFTEQIDDYKPNTTNGHTMSVFSRVIQAGDPTTYNFTLGASGRWAAIAICATDTSTPEDDVAPSTTNATNRDSAGDGTAVTASINTGVANAYHIVVAGWDTGAIGTITTPAGYTLLANANGGGEPIHASYKQIASAGATGTTSIVNTEFGAYITFSFSIKGAAVAATIKTLAALGVG